VNEARTRCVWFTGLAVPVGALLGAFVGARIGRTTGEGMADLAGVITGLIFGGPLLALIVFLVTFRSVAVSRPLIAVVVMAAGASVVALLAIGALAITARIQADNSAAFVLLFVVGAASAAGFARLALTLAQRRV
jgi:hypothetical protein